MTIVDELPCGPHELTLMPLDGNPDKPFVLMGIDVHRPPLVRDASECTTP